jgi:glycosyltransferase involved in cell wall biosynthesis
MHIVIDARNRRSSTGRYTDRLLEHLQKIDTTNRYTVLVQPDDPWQGSSKNFTPLPSPFKQFSFNPFEQLAFAWQLYRLRPSLTHFTMTQQPLLYFGNIVTTTHDLTMLRFTRPGRYPKWVHAIRMVLYHFMFWLSHKKSRAILVPSKFVAKDLSTYQPFTKNKITVTYESSEPPLKDRAVALQGVAKPFIFHVGSPFPHKNIERLIEAFGLLKNNHPTLRLVLVGKKELYFNRLEASLTGQLYTKDILMPGFITDAQLKWLYHNAECYVLPSLSEGFGLPGLEAMAHDCPLVSSNATCLPEVYGNAAHYFNPEDVQDMAHKVSAVLNTPQLSKQLVLNGRKQLKKYSWQTMAKQTLEIYKKTAD